jgi:site-specific recombinase XerD
MVLFSRRLIAVEDSAVPDSATARSGYQVPRVIGDLEPTLEAYSTCLRERRYAPRTVDIYTQCIADFIRWRSRRSRLTAPIDEALVDRFVRRPLEPWRHHARRPRHTAHEEHAALVHWLAMLRAEGRLPMRPAQGEPAIVAEIADFDHHLVEVRGLRPATRTIRRRDVRAFLTACRTRGIRSLDHVRPTTVAEFIADYTAGWKPASIRIAGISLRSYFAFKAISGIATTALCAAIPRVALWRLASVPPCLSDDQLARLMSAFDRTTATGRRDYAITRCLVDLGLRGAEVARLTLDDIDWAAGTLIVRGKSRRADELPLPRATGQAIVAYLRNGRPATARREVFVRHRPPYDLPTAPGIVRNAVRYAAARCALGTRVPGPHILRHTLATRLVQRGSRLKDVADLLRHRSPDTTMLYTKVDLPTLSRVALPWPGSQP